MVLEADLEKFEKVLALQEPKIPGEPFPMKVYTNNLPKCCGNPWRGAYSKHGFWYKFHKGNENDFQKISKLAIEQDSYLLMEDSYTTWCSTYGKDKVTFIVAKNQRQEYMAGIVGIEKSSCYQIGFYFVQEDYRHSLIGQQLFREVSKVSKGLGKTLIFQSTSTLLKKSHKFGLSLQFGRIFRHVVLKKPEGFPKLSNSPHFKIIESLKDMTKEEQKSLKEYDLKISGEKRNISQMYFSKKTKIFSAFLKEVCVGYLVRQEVQGINLPSEILIAPLYSNDSKIAESLLRASLKEFFNPEEDFEFDPDVNAIYRRNIHFISPENNDELMRILEILDDKKDRIITKRIYYQTISTGLLPGVSLSNVHSVGDLFSMII